MLTREEITENIFQVRQKFDLAVDRAGRELSQIVLLAVSKKFPVEVIQNAISAGHYCFAENYVQEAVQKVDRLQNSVDDFSKLRFDLIGNLQSNKVKKVVGKFELIHTVDRESVLEQVDKIAKELGLVQKILMQVNISAEENKSGVSEKDLVELCKKAISLENVSLQGLMMIGTYFPVEADDSLRRSEFIRLRELRDRVSLELGVELPELSMGMSHDFDLAIEEGATIVRVGSAIFGARDG